ncbi:abasic site processing protein HMCES isoform X1 [Ixodes scapularis]|uniref:abasic site processing protein HMCES isoform X1 n=1 Tax=Ixodes scapularis TaxID=6945 RepID=UPI001A9DC4ED|nr:abasic site processing protein HMCES isoform X1 [Ixodes scapularis]
MCGRMACALNKGCLQHACQYQDATGQYRCPKWVDLNSQGKYKPSYNISPRTYHPVLLNSCLAPGDKRVKKEKGVDEGVIMTSMRWGLVPSWHTSDPRNFLFNTVNCRVEECMERRSFKGAIAAGRRCVVPAEGFFEWHKEDKTSRQPYLVYFRQPKAVSMAVRTWDDISDAHQLMQGGQWAGPRLLTMAGLFDVSTCEEDLYSFTILTMNSPKYLQWLHDRVPVILSGEDAVAEWLDPNNSFEKLTRSVHCPKDLEWHPVSSEVGKVTNNSVKCVLPISKTSCTERATSLSPSSSGSSTVEDAAAQRTPASPVVQHNQRWTCEAAQQYQRRAKRQLDLEDENIHLEGKYRNGAIQAANATLAAANAARSFYALGEEVLREKRELVRLETTRAQLQIELIKRQLGQD